MYILILFLAAVQVYSSCQFAFSPVPSIYQHIQEVSRHFICTSNFKLSFDWNFEVLNFLCTSVPQLRGDWKAGKDKPKFRVTLTSASHVLLQLRGPRKYYVWLEMKSESPAVNFKQDSGPSRYSICMCFHWVSHHVCVCVSVCVCVCVHVCVCECVCVCVCESQCTFEMVICRDSSIQTVAVVLPQLHLQRGIEGCYLWTTERTKRESIC